MSEKDPSKSTLKSCYDIATRAMELDADNPLYHYNMAQISYLQKKKRVALKNANQALALSKDTETDKAQIQKLIESIAAL